MDENNNRNLILATVLSFLVIMVWYVLFPPAEQAPLAEAPAISQPAQTGAQTGDLAVPDLAQAAAQAPRLAIETPELEGSISLLGGRIDDLSLKSYRNTIEADSGNVRLLSPVGDAKPFYAVFGWSQGVGLEAQDVPSAQTEWRIAEGASLAPGQPVTLAWENGKGQSFTRKIAVDDKFMFTVTDAVQNGGSSEVSLGAYSQLARHGVPSDLPKMFILHEGAIGRADGELFESDYGDIAELPVVEREASPASVVNATKDGWIGFTDHYWMAILVPEQGKPFTQVTKHYAAQDIYQTEVRQPLVAVAPGASAEVTTRFFAGAKEWQAIREYQNEPGMFGVDPDPSRAPIPGFIDSIDWGWFFFLTKPIFAMLHFLNGLIGNMGLAIMALTLVLKMIVLPLAYKSYVSMARMKELQPEIEALKERAGDDRQMLQKEMMQLYRTKKVNPAAGCLPILIQIPIFFSLYKVIFVTIELRHAAFFGWIQDLSMPDPSSLFNLFGILPWDAPMLGSTLHLIFIGALPILLGITMYLQQKLNPAPSDPAQAMVFAWMPWVFMFMLGGFASGLVVYWITNNLITFIQQYTIMRAHGHRPDVFGNIRSGLKRKKKAPAVANANGAPKASKSKK